MKFKVEAVDVLGNIVMNAACMYVIAPIVQAWRMYKKCIDIALLFYSYIIKTKH